MTKPKYLTATDAQGQQTFYDVEDMIAQDLNRFQGWECDAGLESLYIDYDGSVWVANCAGSRANPNAAHPHFKQKFGYVGSILEDQYQWPKSAVICPFSHCGCGADIPVTKSTKQSATKITSVRRSHPWPRFVQWDLGRWCNYSCSYCWPSVHNKTDPHKTLDVMTRAVDRIHQEWSAGHRTQWSFGGGEPTINPEFIDIVEYLKSADDYVSLVTNGSRSEDYYRRLSRSVDSIQFSLHFEFWKRDVFERNVLSVLEEFRDRGHGWLEIKIMAKPGQVAESLELQKYFNDVIARHAVEGRWLGYATCVPLRDITDGSQLAIYPEHELRFLL
jgi:MoaA/NifB/PqqE/SkfB family radical SAM enzyme